MKKESERKSLYKIGWIFLILGSILYILVKVSHISAGSFLLPCLVHKYTGLYCPGCGGTRAFTFLMDGHFLKSLYYHPVVLYGAALYLWFMISNTIELLSKGRFKVGMYYRDRYIHLAVIIIILNFIVKNAVLIIWKYPMIP